MRRFHWGWRIGIVYVFFAGATLAWVVFALMTPVDLVRDDYYEESLHHDAMMKERLNADRVGAHMEVANGVLTVSIPPHSLPLEPIRTTFYRSDLPELDRTIVTPCDSSGITRIDLHGLKRGKWIGTARWVVARDTYEIEHPFFAE